jgi:hypothetical protein
MDSLRNPSATESARSSSSSTTSTRIPVSVLAGELRTG